MFPSDKNLCYKIPSCKQPVTANHFYHVTKIFYDILQLLLHVYNTARLFPCFQLDNIAVYNVHIHGFSFYI